jgi:hypothetical protein
MVTANSVVAERWRIAEVDPDNPMLAERDREVLRLLVRKHQVYIEQGRGREAHGMGTAILVVWQVAMRPGNGAELPDTGLGDF